MRDEDGDPVVIRNAPLLDDGTPMPTRYWLVGRDEVRAVSRLEAAGGVRPRRGGRRRRPRSPTPTAATPPSATPTSGRAATARARRAAWAARAEASSACTPTTPGTWPVATTPSGAGSRTGWPSPARRRRSAPRSTRARHAGRDVRASAVGPGRCWPASSPTPTRRRPPAHQRPRPRRPTTSTTCVRELAGVVDADDVHVRGAEPWHLAAVERGGPPPTARASSSIATPPRTSSAPWPRRRRADRLHNPGSTPSGVDTVLGTCCLVLAVMRRLHLARVDVRGPGRLMARHPSAGARLPSPLRLYGRRVDAAPARPHDFAEWSEVRRRNEAWLTPWEPRRPPAQLDPTVNRDAFAARCAARDRDAAAGVAYGFGVFVDHRLAGEVNLNNVLRGAMQCGHRRLLDRPGARRPGPDRRGRRRASPPSPSSSSTCTAWRSASCRATPTAAG